LSLIPAVVLAGLIFTDCGLILFVDEDGILLSSNCMHSNLIGNKILRDDVLGKADVRYIEGANAVGVDLADPYAQDDFVLELHIPKGKRFFFK
jgi:cytochrome c oxidase subunit 2